MEKIEGKIQEIKFRANQVDDYYAVIAIATKSGKEMCVGQLPGIYVGAEVVVTGEKEDSKYGERLRAQAITVKRPREEAAMVEYLTSGLVVGVKKGLAQKLVDHFHEYTFRILDEEPERITEVHGIGEKRKKAIINGWATDQATRNLVMFFTKARLTVAQAITIVKRYGPNAVDVVKANPYILADEIDGIGFKRADAAALEIGIPFDSEERVTSAIMWVMQERAEREGDCFLSRSEIVYNTSKLIRVSGNRIEECLELLTLKHQLVNQGTRYYIPQLYSTEQEVAYMLAARRGDSFSMTATVPIDYIEERTRIHYDGSQKEAIEKALNSKILVMTGGPGTGKTTTVQAIIEGYRLKNLKVVLAAPTGRAAKRMTEATGYEAKTIHRLLEYNGWSFCKGRDDPIDGDILIVDEASMIDIRLMECLLRAIPRYMTLILVGDVDQLPSVGPGNVLRDIIKSGRIPVATLQYIHRQDHTSLIAENAQHINRGEPVMFGHKAEDDFFGIGFEENEAIRNTLLRCVKEYAGKHDGSIAGLQILTPMKKNALGTVELNSMIQSELNPPDPHKQELRTNEGVFRLGDRVMQVKNNYEKEVFNGDIGYVHEISLDGKELWVAYPEQTVMYEAHELQQIILAYAVTVHKSQGSEYETVIMPLTTSHNIMLKRKLFYTAVTRAKKKFVLIGSNKALARAIQNNEEEKRNTYLSELLQVGSLSTANK